MDLVVVKIEKSILNMLNRLLILVVKLNRDDQFFVRFRGAIIYKNGYVIKHLICYDNYHII